MVVLNSFRAIYCFACISCKALIPRCMTVLAAWHVTCCQQFFCQQLQSYGEPVGMIICPCLAWLVNLPFSHRAEKLKPEPGAKSEQQAVVSS